MLCSWSEFLAFFYRSTMGCLFGCFGLRNDRHRPSSRLVSDSSREPVVYRNRRRLGSMLSSEEDGSICSEKQYNLLESPQPDFDFRDLEDEAKFLKACGTLPETPAEIRKTSELLKHSSNNGDSDSLKFHSWLPNSSIQKLNLEMQPDQPPTPDKHGEDCVSESGSSGRTPSSCISSGQFPSRISTITAEDGNASNLGTVFSVHTIQTTSVQCKNKSVRFDCQSDLSAFSSKGSSEICSQNSEQYELAGDGSVTEMSPYPTPLKLTDDMQTPGTVFLSYVKNMENGKNPRIRSQYVHSVLNPVENISEWKVLKEEDSHQNQQSANLIESEEADKGTPNAEGGMRTSSFEEEVKVEASLSSWLKPPIEHQTANDLRVVSFAKENVYFGKTPGDRPILGTVAAHWNEDEASSVSPKWWDGNGIPNSTTKYKEDQKVSWHATPFEERLEKALSGRP